MGNKKIIIEKNDIGYLIDTQDGEPKIQCSGLKEVYDYIEQLFEGKLDPNVENQESKEDDDDSSLLSTAAVVGAELVSEALSDASSDSSSDSSSSDDFSGCGGDSGGGGASGDY